MFLVYKKINWLEGKLSSESKEKKIQKILNNIDKNLLKRPHGPEIEIKFWQLVVLCLNLLLKEVPVWKTSKFISERL